MRQHLKLIGKNMIAQGIGTVMTLGFTVVAARLLSVADYGELRYVMTLIPLLMAITLTGYDPVILRKANMRQPVPMTRILRLRMTMGLIGSLLILLATCVLHDRMSDTLFYFLIITACALPLLETSSGYKNYLIGRHLRQRSLDLVLQAKIISLLILGLSISAIYLLQLSWLYLFPAYLLALIIPSQLALARITFPHFKKRFFKGTLDVSAALAVTGAGLIYTLAYSLDRLWVRHEMGAEQLALYALLIMVPQEVAKLIDTITPFYYRDLFYAKEPLKLARLKIPLLLISVLVIGYTFSFYLLSAFIFGPAYTYPLLSVFLSGLLIFTLSVEYFFIHKILALKGGHSMFGYSITSLITGALAILAGVALGSIDTLLLALLFKQLVMPPVFMMVLRKVSRAV